MNHLFKSTVLVFTSIFCLFAFNVKEGQIVIDEETGNGLCKSRALYGYPVVVDWNGDGINDLLIGIRDGNIRYYENHGTNLDKRFKGFSLLESDDSLITVSSY